MSNFLEALPVLRTSCDLVVLIRQKLAFPTDAKTIEGLSLTRDQMTASIGNFRWASSCGLPILFSLHQQPNFKLIYWARRERGDLLLMKVTDGTAHFHISC